jgi:hypothetical protein
MLEYSRHYACLKHSNFLKVTAPNIQPLPAECIGFMLAERNKHREVQSLSISRISTTSVLTATTLIYAIGAGITAAAGTRLALQWILIKGFKLNSFQLQDLLVLH